MFHIGQFLRDSWHHSPTVPHLNKGLRRAVGLSGRLSRWIEIWQYRKSHPVTSSARPV